MNLKERMLSLAGEKIEEQSQPVKEINEGELNESFSATDVINMAKNWIKTHDRKAAKAYENRARTRSRAGNLSAFDIKVIEKIKELSKKNKEEIKEGFDAHVLCNSCGSGNLKLSRKKSKIKCEDCGNTGLTESVVGLNEMARTKEQYAKGKEKLNAEINEKKAKYMKNAEDSIDRTMDMRNE